LNLSLQHLLFYISYPLRISLLIYHLSFPLKSVHHIFDFVVHKEKDYVHYVFEDIDIEDSFDDGVSDTGADVEDAVAAVVVAAINYIHNLSLIFLMLDSFLG